MARKLSLLLATAVVVAFAVPAYASAAPELTIGGAKAGAGAPLTGTIKDHIIKTSIGNLTCETVTYQLEVEDNTGVTVELGGVGQGATANCNFKGTPITIDDPTLRRFHSGTSGSGTLVFTYVATLPKGLTCHYSGSAVPATYVSGGNVIHIAGALTATPEACGTASTEGDMTLTSSGGSVVLH